LQLTQRDGDGDADVALFDARDTVELDSAAQEACAKSDQFAGRVMPCPYRSRVAPIIARHLDHEQLARHIQFKSNTAAGLHRGRFAQRVTAQLIDVISGKPR
jgi:hypothetical protein